MAALAGQSTRAATDDDWLLSFFLDTPSLDATGLRYRVRPVLVQKCLRVGPFCGPRKSCRLGRASLLEEPLKLLPANSLALSVTFVGTMKRVTERSGRTSSCTRELLAFATILWFPQKLPVGSSEFVGRTFESFFRQIRSSEFVGRTVESFFPQIRWLSRRPLWDL